jgi:hypothetical protein
VISFPFIRLRFSLYRLFWFIICLYFHLLEIFYSVIENFTSTKFVYSSENDKNLFYPNLLKSPTDFCYSANLFYSILSINISFFLFFSFVSSLSVLLLFFEYFISLLNHERNFQRRAILSE